MMSDLTPKEIAALSIDLRCGASRNRLIETVGGMQHYVINLKAAQAIKQLQATIKEQDKMCSDYFEGHTTNMKRIAELQAKVEKLESALKSNTDAYIRGWVDALAEVHQWSNPTTSLKENDDG